MQFYLPFPVVSIGDGSSWSLRKALMAYKAVAEVTAEEIAATGVPMEEAWRIHLGLRKVISERGGSGPEAWDAISKRLLSPTLPFPLHQMLYYGCYRDFGSNPPAAWIPDRYLLLLFLVLFFCLNRLV